MKIAPLALLPLLTACATWKVTPRALFDSGPSGPNKILVETDRHPAGLVLHGPMAVGDSLVGLVVADRLKSPQHPDGAYRIALSWAEVRGVKVRKVKVLGTAAALAAIGFTALGLANYRGDWGYSGRSFR